MSIGLRTYSFGLAIAFILCRGTLGCRENDDENVFSRLVFEYIETGQLRQAQVQDASTYPLEIVLLQRWLETNKNLKDEQLADAVAKQPWDPSVQALAPLPEVVKLLGDCRSAHAQPRSVVH